MDPRRRLTRLIEAEAVDIEPTTAAARAGWLNLCERLELPADAAEVETNAADAVLWTVPPPAPRAANRAPRRIPWAALGMLATVGVLLAGAFGAAVWWRQAHEKALSLRLQVVAAQKERAEELVVDQGLLLSEYAEEQEVRAYEELLVEDAPPVVNAGRAQARALWRKGLSAYVEGDRKTAAELYEAALAEDPTFHQALTSAGRVAAENGHRAEAEVLFRRALGHEPTYRPAMLNLATLLIMKRNLDEAEHLIKRA